MPPHDPRPLVIAIDGPSGSGKSTVARGVARALGLRYLDTGAMYRALTWLVLERGVDPHDAAAVASVAAQARLDIGTDPDGVAVGVDGVDVSGPIRGPAVTAAVSSVSAVPAVRRLMVQRQRDAIGAGGIVVEGRDIGTVVAPQAPVKIFLTADAAARALRRARESDAVIDEAALAATGASMRRRDALDSGREVSPLARAADATVIDSTGLSADDVVAAVVALAREVAR